MRGMGWPHRDVDHAGSGSRRTRQREPAGFDQSNHSDAALVVCLARRSHFPEICNHPETNSRSYYLHRVALTEMERDMNTVIAKHLARSSEKTVSSFDGLVSVAIFSCVSLLIS